MVPGMPGDQQSGHILLNVHGTVSYGSDGKQVKQFSQSFVLARDLQPGGGHFFVAQDYFRFTN